MVCDEWFSSQRTHPSGNQLKESEIKIERRWDNKSLFFQRKINVLHSTFKIFFIKNRLVDLKVFSSIMMSIESSEECFANF